MDWQCPDTVTAVYEYPGDFMVTFTGSINSSVDDGGVMFCGSDATLKIDRSHLAVYPEGVSPVPGIAGAGTGTLHALRARWNA